MIPLKVLGRLSHQEMMRQDVPFHTGTCTKYAIALSVVRSEPKHTTVSTTGVNLGPKPFARRSFGSYTHQEQYLTKEHKSK